MHRLLNCIIKKFRQTVSPQVGYNLWAATYDDQKFNLLTSLDAEILEALLVDLQPGNSIIADIGCGTGRNWPLLNSFHPSQLIGFDISQNMLRQLVAKFPDADARLCTDHRLPQIPLAYFDSIISSLCLVYFKDLKPVFQEWDRVLKPGGSILFTSNHPSAMKRGSRIAFNSGGKQIAIKHYHHSLNTIHEIADLHGLICTQFIERRVELSARPVFEARNALPSYELMLNQPILYGIRFQKPIQSKMG